MTRGVGGSSAEVELAKLSPRTDYVPITVSERLARIEKAQRLMVEQGIDALYLDASTSLYYFTGLRLWASERLHGAVIPARGDLFYISPGFEEEKTRAMLLFGDDGSVFVADSWNGRVQLYGGEGRYLRQWEVPGWHGQSLDNKPYIAVDGEGQVFASDPEGYRILVWDAVGNPLDLWGDYGSDAASFDLPTGIALDAKGGLYVTDAGNNRVLYFAPE